MRSEHISALMLAVVVVSIIVFGVWCAWHAFAAAKGDRWPFNYGAVLSVIALTMVAIVFGS